jgi:ribonucleoside-triphosphate reductase
VAKVFHPILVSVVGAVGTCIANLNDYAILGWLFRHHRVKKVRDISTYRKLLSFFDRYAFLTLSVASFLPIPIDVIRMLAISRAYTYWKYILATFVGRLPRYLILAYVGKELPAKYILVLFILTTLPAVVKFVSDMIKKRRRA